MELQYFGANCIRIITKQATVTIDDNLEDLGLKSVTKPGDIALFTGPHGAPKVETKLIIDQPGEYEVSDISVAGIAARAHIDESDKKTVTMYKIAVQDITILIVGHVYPELNDGQLEQLGMIDVMFIPVGGSGYTLDGTGALTLIKKINPKIIIPTHYAVKAIQYPVPQQQLNEALQHLSMEPFQTTEKLKLKPSDIPEASQLIVLEKQ